MNTTRGKLAASLLAVIFVALVGGLGFWAINSSSLNNQPARPMPTPTVIVNSKNIGIAPEQDEAPVVGDTYRGQEPPSGGPSLTLADAKTNSQQIVANGSQPSLLATVTPQTQVQNAGFSSTPQGAAPTAVAVAEAPTAIPSPTVQVVAEVQAAAAQAPVAQSAIPSLVGQWVLTWFPGADLNRGNGTTFKQDVESIWPKFSEWPVDVLKWPNPNNVPNSTLEPRFPEGVGPDGKPTAPEGIEIPDGVPNYCEVIQGELCTNPVEPHHYMLYTGDGECPDGTWKSEAGKGNVLIIVNVGDVTARFDCAFWQGWRNHGRYWGVTPAIGAVTLASHTGNVMHNMPSVLNPQGVVNAGGNCSSPKGCQVVHYVMIFISGNEKLLRLDAETSR